MGALDIDLFTPRAGQVVALSGAAGSGLTRLGLGMLAEVERPGPLACLDVRGWLSPVAAWEAGIPAGRLVIVRCGDRGRWPQVVAAVCEGVPAVYAEVPAGVRDQMLRRLAALARARRTAVLLRPLAGDLPSGVAHLRIAARGVVWEGADGGHGRLRRRRLVVELAGRAAGGRTLLYEVEDDGTHPVRVVPRLAAAAESRGGAAAG